MCQDISQTASTQRKYTWFADNEMLGQRIFTVNEGAKKGKQMFYLILLKIAVTDRLFDNWLKTLSDCKFDNFHSA